MKSRILIGVVLFVIPAILNAQTTADSTFYSILDRGGATVSTIGGTSDLIAGYARVQPGAATTPPASFAVIGYRRNDVLVTEGSIAAVRPILAGRTYVEVNGPTNTAVAFVNTNGLAVTVTFQFTDNNGNSLGQATFNLDPGAKLAGFLSESPFNLNSFTGTLTFSASAPIGVTALRTLTNQRGEFLIANQPIVSLQNLSSAPLLLPHFTDGGGWTSQVILLNPSDQTITGTVEFFGEGTATTAAVAVSLVANGVSNSQFSYRIPPRSAVKIETSGTSSPLQSGSVRVTPASGTTAPSGFTLLSLAANGVTVSQATASGETPSSAFRMFVEASGTFGESGSIQSAVALANTSSAAATVTFELWTLAGVNTGITGLVTVPAFGHASRFFSDIFPDVLLPVRALVRVTGGTSQLSIAAFRGRFNERQEFLLTGTPVSNELAPNTPGELVIPQIVDMGGYSTQFVIFSGTLNQSALGNIRFFSPSGQPISLTFR